LVVYIICINDARSNKYQRRIRIAERKKERKKERKEKQEENAEKY